MKFLIYLFMALAGISAMSQNCDATLSGTIIDTHDDTALAGATVIVLESDAAVVSDFDGAFTISNLCDGSYNLQISHPECKTKLFTIEVQGNTSKTFRLEHHLEQLNEIIVTGSAYITKTESLLENRIDNTVLDDYSGATLGDALAT
ncbi:MAG: carboxypeptidase-like regulatory domain-containing protein, partial [Marinirhabdus sp.]|nr:carboxypeptidase-like regulatory domain-containing protein [Marinirhabdus sp.]